ncbi:MAG: CBS domain-containing protein [Candidatus Jettenia sp.]|uniref:CBS domain-containing protein n=1 Tax=Candidatus Jettenia caeni TaxID=247490 RepID=I3IKV9_9BACT|nr:CBS domain-containing protein [Candidatus Jettenia sp. AMX1]MBC6929558.1 CBS domain-containing protein [Candidatus Jettenia sp.]WKZ14202.1 MAG: CBS domain-containing protein [Candidatus Jettenia caeni]KAA0247800.1 MAG: CBS domain-containing protein [Candidatus Jettenia sp. AMX1]MCE7881069.1 CBS domain-containing protein [Candidatus Jettenia sp. AMX1]MCQ3927793.1 CBS domain-containing protein [Candidatus Jettenia sp.]
MTQIVIKDNYRIKHEEYKVMRVKDIMDASPNLIRTSDTFEYLIRMLNEVKYRVIFVVDKEDRLAGIITEADIIKVLIPKYITFDEFLISAMDESYLEKKCIENRDLTITEIMTKTVLSVHEDDTVTKAAALMVVNKIHNLPVVRDSKVVGIVHLINLIRHIMNILAKGSV